MLQPYASHAAHSKGRRYPTTPVPTRDDFQRDRDRVVHSTAFRRLIYKTQVFLNHEGDLYRTRLTHTLEVAQVARSVARALGLNEDLCEAIALAHDLGHTPFGHAGQDALDESVRGIDPEFGGFEHNLQSLRVVDVLEERYPAHDGLNLTFETREGILKHCSRRHALALEASEPGGVGRRFIDRTRPSLEAQVCNLADEIAYNAHDIDDGVRSGLLNHEQLLELPFWRECHEEAVAQHPGLNGRRLHHDTIRRLLSAQVQDLIDRSGELLSEHSPPDADAVRAEIPLIASSGQMMERVAPVRTFLREHLYRHPRVMQTTTHAKLVMSELFTLYVEQPTLLPPRYAAAEPSLRRIVDYIAGMTDRFAMSEHARLVACGA